MAQGEQSMQVPPGQRLRTGTPSPLPAITDSKQRALYLQWEVFKESTTRIVDEGGGGE